jgi:hypothetical protein
MKIITILLIVVSIFGCEGKSPTNTKVPEKQQQASLPAVPPNANPPSVAATRLSVTGTVLEIIDVTEGIYMRLKTSKGETWAAVNKASVKKGSEVTVVNAIPMDGFESKKLKRKFDHIVFGSLATGSGPTAGSPHQPMPPGKGMPTDKQAATVPQHPAMANDPVDMGNIQVKKAEGAEGKTVAEIFAARASLKDATVSLRGKVIKFNAGIMGKNWLHLRDGSGLPEKKDNDITVTTSDSTKVGDVVLVRGMVRLDRDFGVGYAYPVIIEDAKVSR